MPARPMPKGKAKRLRLRGGHFVGERNRQERPFVKGQKGGGAAKK